MSVTEEGYEEAYEEAYEVIMRTDKKLGDYVDR